MTRVLAIPLLLLAIATLPALEDGSPPLPPQPRTTPGTPALEKADANAEDQLQRRIDREVHNRDQAISVLMQAGTAANVPEPDAKDPQFAEPMKAAKAARRDLKIALEDYVSRTPRVQKDVLDRGERRTQAGLAAPLEAQNLLAIAECYKDLASGPQGTAQDVTDGQESLAKLDLARLPDGDRPRAVYLRLWFQLEKLRKAPADLPVTDRRKWMTEARAIQNELTSQFPASELSLTADALFRGLEDAPAKEAP